MSGFRISALCRTTGRISDLEVKVDEKTKQERKSIFFTVVADRPYKVTKTVNGKTVTEKPSDYMFCKATGIIAELIDKHCKEDTGKTSTNGKKIYKSRLLLLHGHLETYEKDAPIKCNKDLFFNILDSNVQNVKIGVTDKAGQSPSAMPLTQEQVKVTFEFTKTDNKVKETLFVVHDIDFVDKAPEQQGSTSLTDNSGSGFSIKLGDTSSSSSNGDSNRNGNNESTVSMDNTQQTTTQETNQTNTSATVDDGDLNSNMFNGDITSGNAPF